MAWIRKPGIFLGVVLAGIGVDLLTKKLVFDWLTGTWTRPIIPGVLQFSLAENHGVAFSLLKDHPVLIVSFTSLSICFLLWLYFRFRQEASLVTLAALALLVIGATGNLIDRLMLGYVRDFLDFIPELPVIGHWAVFNVADVCITVGVLTFLAAELFVTRPNTERALNSAE